MDDLLELTGRVEATHFWFRGFRRFVGPVLRELADGRSGLRLLDCGCGTGFNLQLLRSYGRPIGLDLTPGGLGQARASGAPLVRADMAHIPFGPATFDLVTSFDVLQCIDDDRQVMREMVRVLCPGGSVVITAAALNALKGGHAASWPEARRYTRAGMRALAEGAGLRVVRLTYLFASLFPMMLVTRIAQRARGHRPVAADDWEMRVPPAPVNGMLTGLVGLEAALVRRVPMPVGSSVLLVATKPF